MLFSQVGITILRLFELTVFTFSSLQLSKQLCFRELFIRINFSRVLSVRREQNELGV